MPFLETALQFGLEILVMVAFVVAAVSIKLVMSSSKVKLWVKTAVFFVVTQSIAAVIGWLSWRTVVDGSRTYTGLAVAAILMICFLVAAIYGHRKGWEQND